MRHRNDVYSAIHVIQTELGITGTTSKEASSTISGSVSAMKASWTNLITGIADENANVEQLINNFVDSVVTVGDNLIPRIEVVLDGVGRLIEELFPVIVSKIPVIISEILPDLIKAGIDMVDSLMEGFVDNLPVLKNAAKEIVNAILDGIGDICPVLSPVTDAIQVLIENFDTTLAVLVPLTAAFVAYKAAMAISSLINGVTTAMQGMTIAQYALNLAMSLNPIGVIIALITALVAAFVYLWNTNEEFRQFWIDIWDKISSFFVNTWNNIVSFFTETIPNLINDIGTWFSELPENIAYWLGFILIKAIIWATEMKEKAQEAAKNFVDTTITFIKALPEKIWTWFMNVIGKVTQFRQNLMDKAKEIGKNFVDGLIDFVKDLPDKFTEIGSNIISGIWNGISSGWDWLKEKVSDVANSLFQGAKDALDIHSPSRKFKWIGEMCVAGMEEPLEEYDPYATLGKSMNANVGTMKASFATMQSNSSYGFGNQNARSGIGNVYVYLEGDAKKIFRVVKVENDNIINTTGVNPLGG